MSKKVKIILFSVLLVLVLLVGTVCGLVMYYFSGLTIDNTIPVDKEALNIDLDYYNEKDLEEGEITNIALFGLDTRNNDDSGRSDALMVVTVDKKHHKIKLTSIARDTKAEIEGHGQDKINHAYSFGGAELAIKTLNQNFKLDITDYVSVNFAQVASIIDRMGGVNITLTEAEASQLGLSAGNVLLNGKQAVSYSRIRYIDNDNVRTSRQRTVLTALFNKARTLDITEYPGLIKEFMGMCTTSLGYTEIFDLATIMMDKQLTLEQAAYPNEKSNAWGGIMDDGIWYYVYDLEAATESLHKFIYDDINPANQTN